MNQRLLQKRIGYIISRGSLYGLMGILVSLGYALIVTGVSLLFNQTFTAPSNLLIAGVVLFVIAVLFYPLRQRLEKIINSVFFRAEQAYQERLQTFNTELTNLLDLSKITNLLWQYIEQALWPSSLHIFIYDSRSDQYIAVNNPKGEITSDIRFSRNSPFIQKLIQGNKSLILRDFDNLADDIKQEQARLRLLGSILFTPLPGDQQMLGFVAMGLQLSGEFYSPNQLNYLETLCHQATLAIERTQAVLNLENRVREMNVLARISEGVNVTLSLDDILELIFAQTTQIIPADDFRIVLYDKGTKAHHNIFFVERNERLQQYENRFFSGEQTLENEVIQHRSSIITDDYAKECQQRGIAVANSNIFAWMSVPLNSGAESIGALSMGKRDASITYTMEQLNLLEAIADQAAGAIVKTRLLQETDRRAHQFSTLNEVSRQLTSTFNLEPLLQIIMQSAVDLLICDAGSLLLLDEQTGELISRVATGPVGKKLLNTRLPPGEGIAGKVATTKMPEIVNNIQTAQEWYSKTDQQTGFKTEGMLAIPLMVKETVLGVVEVLNKKDGTPFNQDDQELLQAFSAQAGVAIDNARLYTMTDEELTARVEELSVMQRIDRELNTSLDTITAMRITLEWAMRQSDSSAGLVGAVRENGINIMASQGYADELHPYQDSLLPIDLFNLQEVIEKGAPQRLLIQEDKNALLHTAHSRTIIPIRRESTTIGILLLESNQNEIIPDKKMDFLTRLSDHASIAISNAELYTKVQAANVAKSEFVSFVSHELKNPMTSIKGYTELIAAGAVGPINEAQGNFLSTIKSNVERMATLVSDLADVSRIEAGRLKLEYKAFKVKEVVDEIIRTQQRQLDDKKQKLIVQLPEGLPSVWADRMRYGQILLNLVSNAYKYTPEGGTIHLSAEACDNQWDEKGAPKVVHTWVKDDGIGISPDDQKKIFQKFFRSEDSKAREAPGTGLGLNITKNLIEMQGGLIWFDSELRKGTTFHFTMPVAE